MFDFNIAIFPVYEEQENWSGLNNWPDSLTVKIRNHGLVYQTIKGLLLEAIHTRGVVIERSIVTLSLSCFMIQLVEIMTNSSYL